MKDLIRFFSKNTFFFLFLLLEGLSFLLIAQHNSFQKSFIVNSSRTVSGFIYQNLQAYREYFHLRKINQSLLSENSKLLNELSLVRDDSIRNNFYLSLPDGKQYNYYSVRVVNNSVSKQYNYITLDAGRKQGLAEDMAVISEKGVVGIITGISENFAVVLPVLNRDFRISAKILRNNYFGVAEWDGFSNQIILLKEIPSHADVRLGDTIVTSGHSAIFPEGILIGTVSQINIGDGNFYDIKLNLSNDFSNLYYLAVINNSKKEEQISLENKSGL